MPSTGRGTRGDIEDVRLLHALHRQFALEASPKRVVLAHPVQDAPKHGQLRAVSGADVLQDVLQPDVVGCAPIVGESVEEFEADRVRGRWR